MDIPNSGPETVYHVVENLTNDTLYCFRVRAVNPAGNGAAATSEFIATARADSITTLTSDQPNNRVTEGDTGKKDVVITLTLSEAAPSGGHLFSLSYLSGTATDNQVLTAAGCTTPNPANADVCFPQRANFSDITIPQGQTTATWTLGILGDTTDEDDETVVIKAEASAFGQGYAVIPITIVDNDAVGVTVSTAALTVAEAGSGTYTVKLDAQPTGNVTITPSSDDPSAATVSGALTFTTGNWATAQTVTVTRADDTDTTSVTVSHAVAGGGYAGVTASAVRVTLRDTTAAQQAARANTVHRAVLPQVAAAVVSQSLGAVADRIEAVAGGQAAGGLRLGALPAFRSPAGRKPQAGTGSSLREVLDGMTFTLPLGSGGDGGLPPVAVWGRGNRVAVAGSEHDVAWDGGLWGAHLGADVRLRPDLLAGVAVSYSLGELDADHTGRTRTTRSTYETDLTAVQPYVAWLGADGSSLWASAGYGWGEVQLKEAAQAARRTDLTFASTAVGGRGVLGSDAEWIAGGVTRLAIKGEGSLAWMETEAGDGLAGLAVDTRRLRLGLQGSHERAMADGATLTPAVEVGLRHDGGDATKGAGVEAGASLRYRDPGLGLTVEVRTRTLLVHERDREEWGVSGLVRLDPAADGRGLFLTLAPERGGTASGLRQLFERTPRVGRAQGAGGPAALRLAAEVGHGFGVISLGRLTVVTPYAGVTLVERGERHWRLGTRYLVGGLELSLEAARLASRTTTAADSLMVQAGMQW